MSPSKSKSKSQSLLLSQRPVGKGFSPRSRRLRRLPLAMVGALSVLFSPFALTAALASYTPSQSGSTGTEPIATSYDSKYVTDLLSTNTKLTKTAFTALVVDFTGSLYGDRAFAGGGSSTYVAADLLAMPTSDSLFYSTTTPRYYKFKSCTQNPSDYFIVGNLLVQSGDMRPEAKAYWDGNDAVQPTPNVTFDLCTQPKVPFTYPSGWTAASTSGNYVQIRHSFPYKIADTVPQDPQRAGFATVYEFVIVTRTNPTTAATLPYAQQGTAVYGTDYSTDSANGVVLSSNSLSLVASPAGVEVSPGGSEVPIYFNPNNHPLKTLQWVFTAPAGYAWLGQPLWNGQINALNNSTVTVSEIGGQSTITPGSTTGGLLLTRSGGDQSVALPVSYTIGGTAANGTDYGYLSGNATIPAGQSTLNVPIITSTPSGSTAVPQKDVLIALMAPADSSYNVPTSGATGQSNDFTIPAYSPSTVSFSQSGGGTLTPGTPQQVTVSRSGGDTSKALTVPYTIGGSATSGSDYYALPGSVTIPAGATTAAISVSSIPHSGTTAVAAKTLTLAPTTGSGYTADPNAAPITYNLPAYTPTAVSVSSPSNGGAIPAGGSGTFTVTRTGDISQPLTVPYTTGGTATAGTDYNQLPGSITIPAGQTSATQTLTTPTPNGSTATPSKTITLTPSAGNGYSVDANNSTANYTTAAYTPASVSAAPGSNGSAIPPGTTGSFTIARTGDLSKALPVTYGLSGTATNGTDYNQLPGSVTIPAGQSSVSVPVTVPTATGSSATPAKTIQVAVNSGSGYSPDSTNPSTTLTIPAYTPSGVSFTTTNGGALTPGGTSDSFTVNRTGSTTQPLTVSVSTAGSATPGADYGQLPANITIPAGQTAVTVPIRAFPQSGTTATPQKDVQLTLQSGAGYAPSSATPATYTIPAYTPTTGNTPAVTVSVPSGQNTLLMPGTSTNGFTVTRTGATTAPLTVAYTVGGTAKSVTDYTPLSGTVTLPAGASTATVPLSVPLTATQGKTVAISVTPGSGYTQGTNSNVTYTVGTLATAPNTSTVALGFDSSIPAFVVTRTGGDTTKALTVPLNFAGTGVPGVDYSQLPMSVTFTAGKTTVTVPVSLLPTAKTGNTVIATIPPGSGYDVGSGDGTSFTVPAGYNDGAAMTALKEPIAVSPTPKKGSGSGLGAGAGFLAGAAGLGSIALGSGGLVTGSAATAASTVVPNLLAGSTLGTIPQSCSTTGETPLQLAQLLPQLKDANPNWSASTFGSVPAPTKAGSIKLGKSTVQWQAGQPVADIVRVGDTDGTFNLHCLGLAKLASVSQLGMAAKPLSTLNLVSDTTLKGLSQSLYRRAKTVGDVKGLAEWIASKSAGRFTAEQLSSLSIGDLLKAEPALASLPLGAVPLNQLPGYSDLLLGDVPGLATKSISQVVGLSKVPFSQFPVQPKPLTALAH